MRCERGRSGILPRPALEPGAEGKSHNQIDLALIRPNGTTAESTLPTANGVFKKVSATTSLATGVWKVRLFGTSVSGTQKVYIAVHKR